MCANVPKGLMMEICDVLVYNVEVSSRLKVLSQQAKDYFTREGVVGVDFDISGMEPMDFFASVPKAWTIGLMMPDGKTIGLVMANRLQ